MKPNPLVEQNIIRHDRVAAVRGTGSYDARHLEIFNFTEQRRLQKALNKAWRYKQTSNNLALDFGCGTGNLAEKLVSLGAQVTASDVSSGMLKLTEEKMPFGVQSGQISTHLLTGEFPLPFPDGHFGFVATYSVLHHVPDYLEAVRELARVVCKGGVLFIDHEAIEDVYKSPQPLGLRIQRNLHLPAFGIPERINRLQKKRMPANEADLAKMQTRELAAEGDIHIYSDDHIEWVKIRKIIEESGFSSLSHEPYLACHEKSRFPWRYWICRTFAVNTVGLVGLKT